MKTLCIFRDIQKALEQYETKFQELNNLNLKEGMLLCCIAESDCTATEIAMKIELSCSNCSKIIQSIEKKGLIQRQLGTNDKRNMFFTLTEKGEAKLLSIQENDIVIPEILKPLF